MARFEVLETRIEGNAAVLKFRCFACGTVEVIQTDTTPGSRKCPSCSAPYWLYDTAAGIELRPHHYCDLCDQPTYEDNVVLIGDRFYGRLQQRCREHATDANWRSRPRRRHINGGVIEVPAEGYNPCSLSTDATQTNVHTGRRDRSTRSAHARSGVTATTTTTSRFGNR